MTQVTGGAAGDDKDTLRGDKKTLNAMMGSTISEAKNRLTKKVHYYKVHNSNSLTGGIL